MDPILTLPDVLPVHDQAPLRPVSHLIIAEWPEGTFLENLAVLDDGSVLVSVMSEARLDRVTMSGDRSVFHQFSAPVTGVALAGNDLFATVGEPGGVIPELWRLDQTNGTGERWMRLDGARFANGLTPFDAGRLLVTESWAGQLLLADLADKSISVWLQDERLTRAPGVEFLPGANGVKRYGDAVTVSSTGRALLLRVAVNADTTAGPIEVIAERLRVDDFAFDSDGNAYLCTHIGHSLDRLTPRGDRVSLGGPLQGLAGSTACAFGRQGNNINALYVTTTGGIVMPHGGVLEPAKLVRLDIGVQGHPLSATTET